MAQVQSTKHDVVLFTGTDEECKNHLETKIHISGRSHTHVLCDDGSTYFSKKESK